MLEECVSLHHYAMLSSLFHMTMPQPMTVIALSDNKTVGNRVCQKAGLLPGCVSSTKHHSSSDVCGVLKPNMSHCFAEARQNLCDTSGQ